MSKGVVNLANVPELESADGGGRTGEAFVKAHGQKGDDAEVNVALWDKMYAASCLHRQPDDFRCFKEGWRKANATTRNCIIRFWRRRVTRSWIAFSLKELTKGMSLGVRGEPSTPRVGQFAAAVQVEMDRDKFSELRLLAVREGPGLPLRRETESPPSSLI